jgi:hypothetical protein
MLFNTAETLAGRLLRFHCPLQLGEKTKGMAAGKSCGAYRRMAKIPPAAVRRVKEEGSQTKANKVLRVAYHQHPPPSTCVGLIMPTSRRQRYPYTHASLKG